MKIRILEDVYAITRTTTAHPVAPHSPGMTAIYSLPS